ADDGIDPVTIGRHVVAHPGDDLTLVERRVGDLPGDAQWLEHFGDAFLQLYTVGGTRDLDGHPDEIAFFDEAVVDEILGPGAAEDDVVSADVSIEARRGIGRVDVDDRDARRIGLACHLDQAPRIRAAGHDAVGARRDGGADRLLVRGHVAAVERGIDGIAGILLPRLGTLEEVGPDRVGRRAVRDPVEGLGLRRTDRNGGRQHYAGRQYSEFLYHAFLRFHVRYSCCRSVANSADRVPVIVEHRKVPTGTQSTRWRVGSAAAAA